MKKKAEFIEKWKPEGNPTSYLFEDDFKSDLDTLLKEVARDVMGYTQRHYAGKRMPKTIEILLKDYWKQLTTDK